MFLLHSSCLLAILIICLKVERECPLQPPTPGHLCITHGGSQDCHYDSSNGGSSNCCCRRCEDDMTCTQDPAAGFGLWQLMHSTLCPVGGCGSEGEWRMVCQNTLKFERLFTTGVITSPNYPNQYPNNVEKTERIEAESGMILRLEFTNFHIYPCADQDGVTTCAACDFVKITDGDGTTLMDNSCGYSSEDPSSSSYFQPPTITTRTNTVEIFFHTDASGTTTGWSLSWIAVTPGLKDFIQTASFIHLNCHYKHFYAESMAIQMDQIDHKKLCCAQICLFQIPIFLKEVDNVSSRCDSRR